MFTTWIQEIIIKICMNMTLTALSFTYPIYFGRWLFIDLVNKAIQHQQTVAFVRVKKRYCICSGGCHKLEEWNDESAKEVYYNI